MADPAVHVEGLVKRFKTTTALAGVDLDVEEGTVFGLLGPNGAGKTTLVRVLATLLAPDAGRAEVFGRDVVKDAAGVRELLGLTGQFAAVDEILTGRENLMMFGRLFDLSAAEARRRANELLERFDLADAADRPARTYSGGMRRRLDLASSLLTRPRVLFLDEPTTGLDPRSRNEIWSVVRELVREGTTLLLTTQYLEEADRLADRRDRPRAGDRTGHGERAQGPRGRADSGSRARECRGTGPCPGRAGWDRLRRPGARRPARAADASGTAGWPRDDRGGGVGATQGGNRGERSRAAPPDAR
ncbi:MAG TPA: ATP-binding cassette domain-containing protein [Solirubrobacteraceae bacterium]|nr:ATP-binding cassette domain-containing protein [Solirubrobacteraceae bacterium]